MNELKESESAFMSWVIDLAHTRGWLVYHTWKSIHSPAGFPDLCMTRNPWNFKKEGRVIFAELKTERGKPTPDQQEWLDNLYMAPGVEAYLWRPSMRPKIERILE